ncbi:hypothetical protein [Thermococcus aciditolerans]|uniref:Uncharacterized protein n=1 Tax=Thermococcus aciditolerans TaxID=2598455 RepID=A0A5C0SNM0_9EURY|nr:hypothetical protein [Thermococcus aciditolerans]QEK15044.1 hypothetical protein FPV09_08010 [Thermococcus aciditolerans]
MVKDIRIVFVLLIGSIVVLTALAAVSESRVESSAFVGLCVYSEDGFSILTNGTESVGVYASLDVGRVYRVTGVPYNSTSGPRMRPESVELAEPTFPLDSVTGAYWPSRGYYLLTPSKIRLAFPIDAAKGEMVSVEGLWHGGRFYPLHYRRLGLPDGPVDGMPWEVEGVVVYSGRQTLLWNGSEEIAVYPPYGVELEPGQRVRVLGTVRLYSRISLFVDSRDDILVLGAAERRPLQGAGIGDIAVGNCTVVGRGRSLKLDCSDLRLYGFSARVGDVIHMEALRRRSSLLCLNCSVIMPREELPNGICSFSEGMFARIRGNVSWVKVYRNGFGIANVTGGECWVLLKIRKSLGIRLDENETVTAYGFFTTYRGMPAFEVASGDDVCSGNC